MIGEGLLDLLFNEDEYVCVSHDGFGYHSVSQDDLRQHTLGLVSPNESVGERFVATADVKLVALNPIKGWRRDDNCTAFRSFLVEMDTGDRRSQQRYVDAMQMPYSACVFSGNKSLHFVITLDADLPNMDVYRYYSRWILNVMQSADQNTLNPSRSVRVPGALRDGRRQELVYLGTRLSQATLDAWLSRYDALRPQVKSDRVKMDTPCFDALSSWVRRELAEGIDFTKGRNARWFAIGYDFGRAGYQESDIEELLTPYFQEEYDFKRSEWAAAIRSGCRKAGDT